MRYKKRVWCEKESEDQSVTWLNIQDIVKVKEKKLKKLKKKKQEIITRLLLAIRDSY
jgi:hypothetical protein